MAAALTGCATSGPAYQKSVFHRLVTKMNAPPLRQGIIHNVWDFPVYVSIDGAPAKKIIHRNYFSVTAGPPHHLVIKDENDNILVDKKDFAVTDSPLGSQSTMRRRKTIDTGWVYP